MADGAKWVLLAIVLSVSTSISPTQTRAAEGVEQDVPGTLWTGPTEASHVGGAVVDQVWRVVIAEPRLGIFRLSGEEGSELGLYLFDGLATSVASASPLRSSSKPGGMQSFAYQLLPGTYYINVNGRNIGRTFAFTLRVSLVEDVTPPFLSIKPDDGKSTVSDSGVWMKAYASDALSGVDGLRWRVSSGPWSSWEPYSSSLVYVNMPASEGAHTVEMQARNGAQLTSAIARFSFVLDFTSPAATLLLPKGPGVVTTPRPTIKYQFNEEMDSAAWRRGGLLVYEYEGVTVQGAYEYDVATRTGTFRPNAPLRAGGAYVVEFSQAADLAGNPPVTGAWTFTYLANTTLNTAIRSLNVNGGDSARIQFRAKGVPAGAPIYLEELVDLGDGVFGWTLLRETTARGGGDLQAIRFTPERSGRYALRFPGSDSHQSSRTSSIELALTPTVEVVGSTAIRSVTAGSEASAAFRVLPANIDQVSLIKYRCNSSFTTCSVVETIPATPDAEGLVRAFWTAERGNWAWRVRVMGDVENEGVKSQPLKFTIR